MTTTLDKYQRCNLNPMADSVETETQNWCQEVSRLKAQYDSLQLTRSMTTTLDKYQRCNLNPMADSVETETQNWCQEVSRLKAQYDSLQLTQRKRLEDLVSIEDATKILEMRDEPMERFESHVWSKYGRFLDGNDATDRRKVTSISKVQACLMMVVTKCICQNLYLKQNL